MAVFVKVQKLSGKSEKRKRGKKYDKSDDDIAIERALKKFKKKVKDSKVLKLYHERMYFVKPSEKKRAERSMARYRAQQQTILNKN